MGKRCVSFTCFFAEVENIKTLNVAYYIRCLALYFIPVNFPNKSVRCATEWKTAQPKSKTLCRALIDMNEYLAFFPGATLANNIDVTELNDITLNRIPNSQSKQPYVQGFDCESIQFKKAVNIFERMEITESIYQGVVETSY